MGLFRKRLGEDVCIVALVALRVLKKRLDADQELTVSARDVAELGVERYGIEIPEDLAEEALEKLVEMGIMRKSEKGYTLTDIAMYAFTSSHSIARRTDHINLPDIARQAIPVALALKSTGYSTTQIIKTMNTLKNIVNCGLKALEKLAKKNTK